jgi:hypothetical protein
MLNEEAINSYQIRQLEYDREYCRDIHNLPVSRKLTHIVLHLTKYLNHLIVPPITESLSTQAIINSFIVATSAANVLQLRLTNKITLLEGEFSSLTFTEQYVSLLASLAKACEACDHQEDYPTRVVWEDIIAEFVSLLSTEAAHRDIDLISEAENKLTLIEHNHFIHNLYYNTSC